jgi:hypothetical protein
MLSVLLSSETLETEPRGQLNLTPRADRAEYAAHVVGEITRWIFEGSVSVSCKRKRALRVSRDCEIGMIEQIVRFRSKHDVRAFPQLEALLQRQVELRERGAAQDITPGIAELTGWWQGECARIKPA